MRLVGYFLAYPKGKKVACMRFRVDLDLVVLSEYAVYKPRVGVCGLTVATAKAIIQLSCQMTKGGMMKEFLMTRLRVSRVPMIALAAVVALAPLVGTARVSQAAHG